MAIATLSYTKRKPNIGAVQQFVFNELKQLWQECIRAFVNEAVKHIHIDTGMSMASLQPLASRVNIPLAISESLRGYGPRKYSPPDDWEGEGKGGVKGPALGASLGQKAYIIEFGTPTNPHLSFRFDIVVFQHYLHEASENYAASVSQNWRSLEKARDAFLNHWNANINSRINGFTLMQKMYS